MTRPEHRCDPEPGGSGQLNESRAYRLMAAYVDDVNSTLTAVPVIAEIIDCRRCLLGVLTYVCSFTGSVLTQDPRQRGAVVAVLDGGLAAALDRVNGESDG